MDINMVLASKQSSWVDLLRSRAERTPDRPAFIYVESGEQAASVSYSQLDTLARRIGAEIQARSHQGDRVFIMLPSCISYISGFFGALYAGCIPVTGYPPGGGRPLTRVRGINDDCSPAIVLTNGRTRELLEQPGIRNQIHFAGPVLDVAELEQKGRPMLDAPERHHELALLQYTSGSTSMPKGVMVSHDNLFHNCEALREGMGFNEDSVIASWLPMHHDMGLIGKILCSVYVGVPCYFMTPVSFVKKPYRWLKMISDHRCTISGAPNFAFDACVQRVTDEEIESLDLSSWHTAWNGSETVRKQTIDDFYRRFARAGLLPTAQHPCYGLAEGTLLVTAKRVEQPALTHSVNMEQLGQRRLVIDSASSANQLDYVSIGHALYDWDMRIVDPETHRECTDGEVGEMWLASDSVALGYWERPEESEQTFRARIVGVDDKTFLRTGDLGARLNGEFYITGRIKDVFISGGRNIFPQDLEATIDVSAPEIQRSAVFLFDEATSGQGEGERICAVVEVELDRRNPLRRERLEALCVLVNRAVHRDHEIGLKDIMLVERGKIPRTSSGKVQRRASRQMFVGDEFRALMHWQREPTSKPAVAELAAEDVLNLLRRELARVAGVDQEEVRRVESVADLGLSSMQSYELIEVLETRLGRALDVEMLYEGNPDLVTLSARMVSSSEAQPPVDVAAPPKRNSAVLMMDRKYQHKASKSGHPFVKSINPEFGRKLSQLMLDKEFVRAEGVWLYDEQGERYLDFLSQYGSLPVGHNHPAIWDAVEQFRDRRGAAMVQPSMLDSAGRLAERLTALAPGDVDLCTFGNSGAEAVEAAIKLSRSSTGRRRMLSTINGFHGKTLGALSATGREKYRRHFAVSDEFDHVPFNNVEALRKKLATGEYAGFIVEPIQGEAGVVEASGEFLRVARELCDETGTLLIIDEVQTGLGRTGTMFCCEQYGIVPDVITVAKSLGGGLVPIGACLARRAVYNDEFGRRHTSTFAGNGLACEVAIRTLELLSADDGALLKHVNEIGLRLKRALIDMQRKYPQLIKSVRGRGLMLALQIAVDRYNFGSGLLAAVGEEEFITSLLMSHLLNHEHVRVAFTLNDGNVLRVQPPLIVEWEACEFFLNALDRTLEALSSRNMARMVAHLVGVNSAQVQDSPTYQANFTRPDYRDRASTFGFLLHPLTPRTYVDFDCSLSAFNRGQLNRLGQIFGDNFDPFLGGENQMLSDTGQMIAGQFWVVPRTGLDLAEMPRAQALFEVQEAFQEVIKSDMNIIGLGAYTSTVTQGGLLLNAPDDCIITNGNTYTALVGFQSVIEMLGRRGMTLSDVTVAIVGATGSIGTGLVHLFASSVRKLILVGNPENHDSSVARMKDSALHALYHEHETLRGIVPREKGKLALEAQRMRSGARPQQLPGPELIELSTDWDSVLPQADVVVTATNSPRAMIEPRHLKRGAVVCDISRPSNVSEQVFKARADVFVYDGGVVRLPGDSDLGVHTDLAHGQGYACMVETMLIALSRRPELAVRGMDVKLTNMVHFQALAQEHGFSVFVPEHRGQAALTG